MDIINYCKKYIEGYLFCDLDNITKKISTPLPLGDTYGAAGYPVLASILAGMELLGYLLMPNDDRFNADAGNDYFNNYWNNYFAKIQQRYIGLSKIFRKLVRHALAHTFITKQGIFVTRGTRQEILINAHEHSLLLDVDVFYADFKRSYKETVLPILTSEEGRLKAVRARMQQKLEYLEESYRSESNRLFDELRENNPTMFNDSFSIRFDATGPSGAPMSVINCSSSLWGRPVSGDVNLPPTKKGNIEGKNGVKKIGRG